jgi:hypothetical protein
VDGINGTDKNLLIRYSARELKEAMDSIDNDEKRFAAHSVNEEGKEFSLAEECARLLRIGRQEGMLSQGKSKKREDARVIEHREWLVWLKEDKVSELKYRTVGFTKEAKQSGGTANRRYHVYCCPELGTGRVAMRRIPCACVACDNTIRLPWVVGVPPEQQLRFQSVTDCKYRKILEERNEWDIIVLEVDHNKANMDDVDAARDEVLVSLSSNIAANVEIGGYGAIVTEDVKADFGYWMIEWTTEPYTCQDTGRLVCDGYYLNPVPGAPKWWTPSGAAETIPLVHIVMADVQMDPIEKGRNMPSSTHVNKKEMLKNEALRIEEDSHDYIFDEMFRRETLEHETRDEDEEEEEEEA